MIRNTEIFNSKLVVRTLLGAAPLLLLQAFVSPASRAQDNGASANMTFEDTALSVQYEGSELIAEPLPSVHKVLLENRSVSQENDYWNYSYDEADTEAKSVSVDPQTQTVTQTYDWGELRVRHTLEDDVLRMRMFLENRTERPIANFRLSLLDLALSKVPEPGKRRSDNVQSTVGKPVAIRAKAGKAQVFACYESIAPPLRFGYGAAREDADGNVYPLVVAGGAKMQPRGELTIPRQGLPHIPPGETLEVEFTLRIAPEGTHRHIVLKPFFKNYQEFWSPTLDWPDRRPIGATFLFSEWGKEQTLFGVEGTNPRRYWSPITDTVDVFSPHGRDILRRALTRLAHRTVDALTEMDAQGAILWNLEGAFHATGFVGDPRMLPIISPELEDGMDDYFRILREAGFRVGCTIRHPQVQWRGNKWAQGVGNANPERDPLHDDFHKLIPDHTPWWQVYPIAERLSRKIDYAKKRWGATIFYYDTSNIMYFYGGNNQKKFSSEPHAHIYRKIREDHPDVLIIPEIAKHSASLSQIAPYGQTGFGRVRPMKGPDYTRDIFPHYFGFHYIHDTGGDPFVPRLQRINEIVWGEILACDGWNYGPKQAAIAEHYRHAGDKMRRVTAFARRFDLIDESLDMLPLPYSYENARELNVPDLVANPPGHSQLRAYTATAKDRNEAALFLAWYGWPYSNYTKLRHDLPGVDLDGAHRRAWDLETGNLLSSNESVHVPAAPATMFRALLVRSADTPPPAPRPKGVAMGVSFDKSLAPDYGGGLLAGEHGDAARTNGNNGDALQITPGGGVARYGVVPSWFSGSVEFDLSAQKTTSSPLSIARFQHHMDTTLSLVNRDGTPTLHLQTRERRGQKRHYSYTSLGPAEGDELELRDAYIPLPDGNDWHRILIAWEIGQYRVFVDGKLGGVVSAPAIIRWRDDSVLEPGLVLGDAGETSGDASAALDSLVLYDWSFRNSDAESRTVDVGFDPLPKPDGQAPTVWMWGNKPQDVKTIAVNCQRSDNGERARNIQATLYEVTEQGLRKLSAGSNEAYRGVRNILMEYEPEAKVTGLESMDTPDGEGEDLFEGLEELSRATTQYVLKIKAGAAGQNPPSREIKIEFGLDGVEYRHW
ncbi:MAG: hypothetical protein ACOCUY_00310 [Verrucomicrobiota bacterium]